MKKLTSLIPWCVFIVNFLKSTYTRENLMWCAKFLLLSRHTWGTWMEKGLSCNAYRQPRFFNRYIYCTCIYRIMNIPTKLPVVGYTACYTWVRTMTSPSVSRRGRRGSPPRGWPAGLTSTASLTESSTPSTSDKSWLTFYTIPHPCK